MVNHNNSADDNSTYDNPCSDYSDNRLTKRATWLYAGYPILVAGTVGHIVTAFLILYTAASLRNTSNRNKRRFSLPPVAIYLLPMAASGLVALYSGLLPRLILEHSCYSVDPISSGHSSAAEDFKCRFAWSVEYYSIQLYSWLAVCIAIERACAIFAPHTYGRWFGRDRRRSCVVSSVAVCTCAIVLLAINTIPFVSYGVDEDGDCVLQNEKLMNVYTYVDCILYSLLPLAVMTPCNALVLLSLVRWRRQHSQQKTEGLATRRTVGATTRRALPLSVASLCLNFTLLLTLAQVVKELRNEDLRPEEVQIHEEFHGRDIDSSLFDGQALNSDSKEEQWIPQTLLELLADLNDLLNYRWEHEFFGDLYNQDALNNWYRNCSSGSLFVTSNLSHSNSVEEEWRLQTFIQLLYKLWDVLDYFFALADGYESSEEGAHDEQNDEQDNNFTTRAVMAPSNDVNENRMWHVRIILRLLCYLRPLTKRLWDLELEQNSGQMEDNAHGQLSVHSRSESLTYASASVSSDEEERNISRLQLITKTRTLLRSMLILERRYDSSLFGGLANEVYRRRSTANSFSSNGSNTDVNNENAQITRTVLIQRLWHLRLLLEHLRLNEHKRLTEVYDETVVGRVTWSIGMLSSYLFCSGSFYIYLVVSAAFRQSAKQLLLSASISKFSPAKHTGEDDHKFSVLRSGATSAERSFATSASNDSFSNVDLLTATV